MAEDPNHKRNGRLSPERRRRQLLEIAYDLLNEQGPDGVQVTEVTNRAAVSRPLFYRFFSNRQAILVAVLEDFGELLSKRFADVMSRVDGGTLYDIAYAYVDSACDVIDERGVGIWNLVMSRTTDADVLATSAELLQRILEPWQVPLQMLLGEDNASPEMVGDLIVSIGDSALQYWLHGLCTRHHAVSVAAKSIAGMLQALSAEPVPARNPDK
jgi:AcrR family transcriptional regulator